MVPKQCPFQRPTFWYLVCCATCLGLRDNSKYHTYPHTYIHDPSRISIDCLTPASSLRRSASVWNRYSLAHDFSTCWRLFTGTIRDASRYGATVSATLARLFPDWRVVGSSPTSGTFLNCDKTVIIKKDVRNHNTRHYSTWYKYSPHHAHFRHIFSHIDSLKKWCQVWHWTRTYRYASLCHVLRARRLTVDAHNITLPQTTFVTLLRPPCATDSSFT